MSDPFNFSKVKANPPLKGDRKSWMGYTILDPPSELIWQPYNFNVFLGYKKYFSIKKNNAKYLTFGVKRVVKKLIFQSNTKVEFRCC